MTILRPVREVLGEEAAAVLDPWVEEKAYRIFEEEIHRIIEKKTVPRDEYREVLSRLDGLEKDVSLIKEEQARFRVDLGQMRAEFQEGQAQMRGEFREDLGELRRDMNERFDRMNEPFDEMNARFGDRFDRMNARFDERFEKLNARFDERFDELNARFDEMHHQMAVQTRWVIGVLALMAAVVSALLGVAQFTP